MVLIALETITWLKFGVISLQIGGNISVMRPLNLMSSKSLEQSSTITEIVWIEFSILDKFYLFYVSFPVKHSKLRLIVKNGSSSGQILKPPLKMISAMTWLTVLAIFESITL